MLILRQHWHLACKKGPFHSCKQISTIHTNTCHQSSHCCLCSPLSKLSRLIHIHQQLTHAQKLIFIWRIKELLIVQLRSIWNQFLQECMTPSLQVWLSILRQASGWAEFLNFTHQQKLQNQLQMYWRKGVWKLTTFTRHGRNLWKGVKRWNSNRIFGGSRVTCVACWHLSMPFHWSCEKLHGCRMLIRKSVRWKSDECFCHFFFRLLIKRALARAWNCTGQLKNILSCFILTEQLHQELLTESRTSMIHMQETSCLKVSWSPQGLGRGSKCWNKWFWPQFPLHTGLHPRVSPP